ncbi:hypothetical protein N8T08_008512 [Aspergillus melleus]|uniref:Uncharacterized protein n=1 Tax=Aspergillus melleus TaxID=138277 RepID=A0ACC3BE47_9EURO|nr:hypothetical protein N8T08_008512 [Aspergillus melleus]
MTTLSFALAPQALIQLHDALICLSKFDETVVLEAEYDLLRLSVLNPTKTSYSAFALEADSFFQDYSFGVLRDANSARTGQSRKFCCQVYLKALLSVFKGRTSGRNKDTGVERCEVDLYEDFDTAECRLVIKMICGLGVIKSYKLTYEPTTAQHAIFDRSKTTNQWSIEPRFLGEITDHFSPSAEQLDIYSEAGKAIFTSFTTKIAEGKEVLKQPVHTAVAIEKKDFEQFLAQDGIHLAISLKDFKAVIAHAETAGAIITARYTRPSRPMQLAYDIEGLRSEFTLMTTGDPGTDDGPVSSRPPELSARQTPAPIQSNTSQPRPSNRSVDVRQMPPPPSRSRSIRPLTGTSARNTQTQPESQPPPASINFESLFVPADDDGQWDVPNDEEEAEDVLGWDATGDQHIDSLGQRLRDTEPSMRRGNQATHEEEEMGIPPTQRMSQLHGLGLFD